MNIIFFGDVGDDNARCIFSRHLCFFSQEGNVTPLTPTHIYRKHHISTRFLIKIIFFHFPPKEKISYFLEKRNTIFPDITKKITPRHEFLGKTIFSEHSKKISYFQVFFFFFEKDHLSFRVRRIRSYFREKEISSFLIIQKRSYSSAIFLERPSFQNIWKKKTWYFVQLTGQYLKWIFISTF